MTATRLAAGLAALAAAAVVAGPAGAWSPPAQGSFEDVAPTMPFFAPIEALFATGDMSGYTCGGPNEPCDAQQRPYFRPYVDVTRGQLARIVALAANADLASPPAQATFADVPASMPFFAPIEALAAAGIVSGYACGGAGEPCDALNRPYFRPFAFVTRAQTAKIVALAGGYDVGSPPAQGTFEDVLPSTAFYAAIEALAAAGVVSGYPCGGPGEPCDVQQRPYFRQYADSTRGQVAKIVAQALVFSDTTAPVPTPPAPILAEATGPAGAQVAFAVTASDSDDPVRSIACTPASGSTFPLGGTTVSCTATDTHLNSSAPLAFAVTVQDTTPPSFAGVPAAFAVDATSPSGAMVSYASPTASDLVDGAVAVTCSPRAGTVFAIGKTLVNCTTADARGNEARTSFKLTVNVAVAQLDVLIRKLSGSTLTVPLSAAKSYLEKGDVPDACAQLADFDRRVPLSTKDAAAILDASAQIQTVAGCKR